MRAKLAMPSQCSPYCGAITVDKKLCPSRPKGRVLVTLQQQRARWPKKSDWKSIHTILGASVRERSSFNMRYTAPHQNHGGTPMRTLLAACGFAILWAAPSAAVPLTG